MDAEASKLEREIQAEHLTQDQVKPSWIVIFQMFDDVNDRKSMKSNQHI